MKTTLQVLAIAVAIVAMSDAHRGWGGYGGYGGWGSHGGWGGWGNYGNWGGHEGNGGHGGNGAHGGNKPNAPDPQDNPEALSTENSQSNENSQSTEDNPEPLSTENSQSTENRQDRRETPLIECKGDASHPAPSMAGVHVLLEDCTGWPCVLQRGRQYHLTENFTAPFDAANLTSTAVGFINGFAVPLSSTIDLNACESLSYPNGERCPCPVKKGQQYVYRRLVEISKKEIQCTFNAHWHLVNEAGDCLTCFEIPIKLE